MSTHGKLKPELKNILQFRKLRISLKYRPDVLRYILKLRHCIQIKKRIILDYEEKLKSKISTNSVLCQTENENFEKESKENENIEKESNSQTDTGWRVPEDGDKVVSIAEQVKEAAQNAMAQSGMVYVESAGMYYDYKTGYYYNSESGLYYHASTGCYYVYSDDNKAFVFHSYADTSQICSENKAHIAHEIRKAKKNKKGKEDEGKDQIKTKRKKNCNNEAADSETKEQSEQDIAENVNNIDSKVEDSSISNDDNVKKIELSNENETKDKSTADLEDGECSQTGSESSSSSASTATIVDNDSVAKQHPPCMRIIVRETNLPKLKVGTLFLITKDGGTLGREGDNHSVLLKDHNVSRNHLSIKYEIDKRAYFATDLGSKNGTILNGIRMSETQEISFPVEIPHGSILEVGETKLLCHIHSGNDTCGHCEPGLIMAADDAEKRAAYTRTCSVQKQHQFELARLKNKYAPEPLAIEDGTYNDRAKARREAVGSSHHSEKTQQSDLETSITPDNKGFQLLKKMGWAKGEGLGKDSQGDTEPVPLVSNESKAGLGALGSATAVGAVAAGPARPMRLAARARPLRPPARLFRDPLEEDDD